MTAEFKKRFVLGGQMTREFVELYQETSALAVDVPYVYTSSMSRLIGVEMTLAQLK